ncbi:unnamed protein product [Adineta ricciae]|uniref:Gamma-glutamyltranspeptidase 1-like protein n=1 Tax=Adineta ricciae TaxID=249248 RepID=A0A815MD91_ADIRI|nr:unnamed protein product [Adineta ricciae]
MSSINDISDETCGSDHESYAVTGSSKLGRYNRAAVAVDNEECSKIGKAILLRGGKAADAAIAASLCNGVLNAHSMGIGGGCVFLIYSRKLGKAFSIVERETAPLNSNSTMFQGRENMSLIGSLAIGTPGEILAYKKAYDQFGGGVSWASLFKPTIRLCEKGFNVSVALAFAIEKNKEHILNDTELRNIFVKNSTTAELYKEGDLMRRPKLARTLQQIADEGVESFYQGRLSNKIVSEIQKRGGILTLNDLRQYGLDFQEALSFNLNSSLKAFTTSAPSSGPILALILNIMLGYDFQPTDLNETNTAALFYHRLTESFKFAFAKRSELADPLKINLQHSIKDLISKSYADTIRQKINDNETFSEVYYGNNNTQSKSITGTAHISIVDEHGDAVAITSTINTYFGSMVVGEETGIIYNNQMNDFSIPEKKNYHGLSESKNNLIEPGKRPVSSQAPLIVLDSDGKVRLVIGGSGGAKIVTSVAHVTLLNLLFHKNVKEANDQPRVHHHLSPNQITFEETFDQGVLNGLKRRGHKTKCTAYGGSVVQAIEWRIEEKQYWANCDVRKGGNPQGY